MQSKGIESRLPLSPATPDGPERDGGSTGEGIDILDSPGRLDRQVELIFLFRG
jgi:hypothetical protein